MALTKKQKVEREGKLTASRVGILMGSSSEKILRLWSQMIGQIEEDDLSNVWPVQLGGVTESLNLNWYERTTGHKLTRRGEVVVMKKINWAAATLDGFDDVNGGPVDAKHVGGYETIETIVNRYTPQMHWQMIVTDSTWSALSIVEGAREPVVHEVLYDSDYGTEMWTRAEAFMQCVEALTPPVILPPVQAPIPQSKWQTVDMVGNNAWASHATDWLENRDEAKLFATATKELKSLIEEDVGLAFGSGVKIKRNKAGHLSITKSRGEANE